MGRVVSCQIADTVRGNVCVLCWYCAVERIVYRGCEQECEMVFGVTWGELLAV
jgi:hypothetical protein